MKYTKTYHLLYILLISLLLSSCREEIVGDMQIWTENTDDISLCVNSKYIMKYNPDKWQRGTSENSFWATRDDLEEFFKIKIYDELIVGKSIDSELYYKIRNQKASTKPKKLKFEVSYISDDGKVWLYNAHHKLGLVIEKTN